MQDTRQDPANPGGPPLLVEHFSFVALRRMLATLPQTIKFCERLVQFRSVLDADPAILRAVEAALRDAESAAELAPPASRDASVVLPQPPGLGPLAGAPELQTAGSSLPVRPFPPRRCVV